MFIRILAIAVLLAASAIWAVRPAAACSCVMPDPREMLERYDAAFVGQAVAHPPPPGGVRSTGDLITYTFDVETTVKGDIGGTVDVLSAAHDISCGFGFGVAEGDRVGVFLRLDEQGTYRGGLCTTIDPDVLLASTSPLPPPDGSGPVRFLIGGFFGDTHLIALDENGRSLAYGGSGGPTAATAVCPGGEHSVEVYGPSGEAMIGIRDLRTFEIVKERRLIDLATASYGSGDEALQDLGGRSRRITEMACLDPSGTSLVSR
jgi:hypothetical protein